LALVRLHPIVLGPDNSDAGVFSMSQGYGEE